MTESPMETAEICPRCRGTGWEPAGERGAVRRCSCGGAARIERLLSRARIPRRYEHCDLDSFMTRKEETSLIRAKQDAHRFLERYPQVDVGLLFLGPPGVGKTHLAVSILKNIITEKGDSGLFYDFRDLLREIQGSYSSVSHSSELDILRPVLETDVLVLDELGANKPTEWVRDTVAHIINCRYNDKKLTIFTSNYLDTPGREPEEAAAGLGRRGMRPHEESLMDRIGNRLRSRLYEMCKVIEIRGKDFRKEIRQAGYVFK